ncbi:response regulator transcription factor [Arcobacter roscoffensis]|uniref:Response regulator n=1 Tax=Arcobacter roscoffensis TaxID=2961520 RepID=A0ABY5E4Q9_9BACT|nr:response regulator [Arcobacter roscoffensis]UTJ06118.1 response regulator [Arcobacter roscoffensis]
MKNISILIVEDEISLLNRFEKYVSLFCDTVYKACNGLEGLRIYKEHNPSIVFTDINMPHFSGVELVEEIRKTDKNTQLILFSAHTNTEDLLKVVPLNLVSYLVKPVKMEQLKQVLFQAVENLTQDKYIKLIDDYKWNIDKKALFLANQKIELSKNENAFINALVLKINQPVSYEDIHNHIYCTEQFSLDALFTIAKRVRKKTTKGFIKSSFKYGYILESY